MWNGANSTPNVNNCIKPQCDKDHPKLSRYFVWSGAEPSPTIGFLGAMSEKKILRRVDTHFKCPVGCQQETIHHHLLLISDLIRSGKAVFCVVFYCKKRLCSAFAAAVTSFPLICTSVEPSQNLVIIGLISLGQYLIYHIRVAKRHGFTGLFS